MKAQLRNQVAALFLLAPAAAALVALPSVAVAQRAPEVRGLEVTSDNGLRPGSRLRFTLHASPNADASVRIRGVEGRIPLREVDRGLYVGRYVIARGDRIEEGRPIRVILRRDNLTVAANYSIPEGLDSVAVAPPPQQLRIDRFSVVPVDRLVAGTELRFMVDGIPGAAGTVALPGVAERVPMREVRPGHYEGRYTIRRTDNLNVSGPIVASLRVGNRIASVNLAEPLVASVRAAPGPIVSGDFRDRGRGGNAGPVQGRVPIEVLSPANYARVDGHFARVRGRTLPFASIEIGVQAAPGQHSAVQKVWEQVVQADANGHFEFNFVAPSPMPGTRYDVSMAARTADAITEAHLVLYQREG